MNRRARGIFISLSSLFCLLGPLVGRSWADTLYGDGILYAELSNIGTSTLATVNVATGQATTIGAITGFGNVSGIAFLDPAVTPVPEPSTFVLMGTALIVLAGFARSRRTSGCQK
jgi:hypothetical protein